MHVFGEDKLFCVVKSDFAFPKKFGNDARDFTASLGNSRRDYTHQAYGAATVNKADIVGCKSIAQFSGRDLKVWIVSQPRSAIDA